MKIARISVRWRSAMEMSQLETGSGGRNDRGLVHRMGFVGFQQKLFGQIGAGAAGARATSAHGQFAQATHTRRCRFTDDAIGHGIADAHVHEEGPDCMKERAYLDRE
jgi:hypothetical protein